MLFTLAIEQGMQRVLASNRVPADWMNIRAGFYFLPAVILSHLVYFRTLIGAHFRKRVKWRGVEYKIDGVNDVQMIGYQPYERPIASRDIQSVV
ncbi:MAG: hypothetical protein IT423_20240 [Pirellulaceae bacterium]|nr:hypothetical protein [Pirellulaceae bacterium]